MARRVGGSVGNVLVTADALVAIPHSPLHCGVAAEERGPLNAKLREHGGPHLELTRVRNTAAICALGAWLSVAPASASMMTTPGAFEVDDYAAKIE